MNRADKDTYSKVVIITSAYTELLRRENGYDDAMGIIMKYHNLAHTIASKIVNTNNTKFILICDKSGSEFSVTMGTPHKCKMVRIIDFKMSYNENSK